MRTVIAGILLSLLLAARQSPGSVLFASGSSQYGIIQESASGAAVYPITIACWFRMDSGGAQTMMAWNWSTSDRFQLDLDSSTNISARSVNGGNSGATGFVAPASSGITPGRWMHITALFLAQNSRACVINGSIFSTTNTGNIAVTNLDRILVGTRRAASAYASFFNGAVGECAIWTNTALTADEIYALGNTNAPVRANQIRPHALYSYLPLVEGTNTAKDRYRGPITWVNSPVNDAHPRVHGE